MTLEAVGTIICDHIREYEQRGVQHGKLFVQELEALCDDPAALHALRDNITRKSVDELRNVHVLGASSSCFVHLDVWRRTRRLWSVADDVPSFADELAEELESTRDALRFALGACDQILESFPDDPWSPWPYQDAGTLQDAINEANAHVFALTGESSPGDVPRDDVPGAAETLIDFAPDVSGAGTLPALLAEWKAWAEVVLALKSTLPKPG